MTVGEAPAGERPSDRRDAIVAAAARLFSEHGYPGTGIDEIGHAVGITGPAVYRHFENKNAVLGAVTIGAIERILDGVAAAIDGSAQPSEVLEALARNVIGEIVAGPAAWAVVISEQRHLEPESAQMLGRAHRLHVAEWVHVLSQLRTDLTDDEMRTMVHCVLGLTVATAGRNRSGLDHQRMTEILVAMTLRVLLDTPAAA